MLRSHQLHKKPIDLHSVIDESLALVAHDLRARQIETTLDLSSTPCVIDGDQVLLQQVLVNLIRNAMDALAEPPARRQITIRSAVTTTDVEVSVCDTGTGLPAEIIATLFTPFVTTKPHGLGIGLVIVQRILDAHGGPSVPTKISTGGRHSRSRCPAAKRPIASQNGWAEQIHPRAHYLQRIGSLPEAPPRTPARRVTGPVDFAEALANAVDGGLRMPSKLRVLIVDDHPGLVRAVCRLLTGDYDVVASVADASRLIEVAHQLQPYVIVLDVNLPKADSLKACRQITQVNPQ